MRDDFISKSEESKKDISDKWLDRIDISLKNLEFYERQLKTGHQDLTEYVNTTLGYNNPYLRSCQAQIESISFFIEEFSIIFNNIEKVIEKSKLEEMRKKLHYCRDINNGKYAKVYTPVSTDKNVLKKLIFEKNFYVLINLLSNLRRELVNQLSHLLWIGKETPREQVEG